MRALAVPLMALICLLAPAGNVQAHEIPNDVTIFAFVKPEAQVAHVLLRLPLSALRDVEFPLRNQTYIDIPRSQPYLNHAAVTWVAEYLTLWENGEALSAPVVTRARISLPSDRSFASYPDAVKLLHAADLDSATEIPWKQALVDLDLTYSIQSAASHFSIEPRLAQLGIHTTTVLRYVTPDGTERAFAYAGNPGVVELDPQWYQAAWAFVQLGFAHILSGMDHLLFVLCLVIPLRRLRPLVTVVTAFTVAHSITLAASAIGFAPTALWFPPLIEVLVAASILFMALENIVGARTDRRWLVAFGFGLVHGFAFSFALRESLQFAGSHLVASLFAFNIGVELGQLLVLALTVPVLALLFSRVVAPRMGIILVSAFVAHTAWHWILDRGSALSQYRFTWPALDRTFAIATMRGLIVLISAAIAAWLLAKAIEQFAPAEPVRVE